MPEDAGAQDEDISRYLERLALVIREAGVQRMAARLFAALLVSNQDALGAKELGERIGVSPGAVSTAVRYLEQTGLVVRTRRPGERRDLYAVPSMDYAMLFNRDKLMRAWLDVVAEGLAIVEPGGPAAARLRQFHELLDFVLQDMQAAAARWEARRAVQQES